MSLKKSLILLLLVLTAVFYAPDAARAEYFVINQYDVYALVSESNRYQVVETLEVDFSTSRHGIIRSIPDRYNHRPVMIENISVEGYDFTVSREAGYVNIKIGNADYTVDGRQVYRIYYDFDVGEDGIDKYDEFYFNLIGPEWETTIKNASFTILMPKEFDAGKVNFTRGYYGSTAAEGLEYEVNGNTITGRITAPLYSQEAVTIALQLPEGYYVGERDTADAAAKMAEYNWFLFPLLILISILIWYRFGRDKPLYPSVQFYPPADINSCDIGYIIDGNVDGKDVTSLLFYWADKGHLAIQQEEKKWFFGKEVFRFIKRRDLDKTAKDYERTVFDDLFSYGDGKQVTTEDLKDKFYKTITKVKGMVTGQFTGEKAIWSSTSKVMAFAVLIMSVVPYIYLTQQAVIYYGIFDNRWLFLVFSGIIAVLMNAGLTAVTSKWDGYTGSQKAVRIITALLVFIFMFGGPAFILLSIGMPVLEALKAAVTGSCTAIIAGLVYQKSEYGHRMYEYLLGFRDFIKEAEKEKIEELIEQNPSYFYNILPYAVVLGVTEKWAEKFESIVTQPPDWYYGSHYGTFNTVSFGRAMDNCFTQANHSMTSSPSSKGSGGGGFSGGGSGGGGGSSW